ncbi:DUF438 domain-containing protein [Paenibacillus polymyxa]|uniref:DUF438 domain-containing protein n=1 Tax=Paenibacillus polymyxa TaxID=1406 RepID=UPI0008D6140E|nr:DUF438 domain-containing protein [Paenibacillus polymyxa]MDN4080469.1 DUF438 domain-containing protein [Paenibacillus polymyxa]MDN4105746.1 DUF438 domain-containing protein [Paenibacillus polymyxa]MDN4115966.1 DUF438 domain-containing protein [Paenibacillus polymyxa]SEK03736.1 hypothetical protein SAMN04488600_10936 [Paenibacillus polymyxa]
MSELINNREHTAQELTERQRTLKEIIKELHAGKSVEEVKARFAEAVGGVSVAEISAMEHALMTEEGIPVSEVQRLCSVHTSIFKGSIEDIHRPSGPEEQPGHPVHTFKLENREIERLVNFKLALHAEQFQKDDSPKVIYKLLEDLSLLMDVDKHYSRKENLVFPYLERYGIFGPTKVMWGVDDGIRAAIKDAKKLLTEYNGDRDQIGKALAHIMSEVNEMIFKEENILLPMALSKLTEDEWLKIARESEEIGFCLTAPEREWIPERAEEPVEALEQTEDTSTSGTPQGFVRFETGIVSVQQLELLLNHLPVDLTFIDENDVVRYFSHGKERIFARTKAVIGRTVQNCHPPQSVHVVEKLLEDFKAGRKDVEDFWIPIKDKFVYIRYFAVRDSEGRYLGTLEFTQNIAPIRALEGQKRILSE